MAVKKILLLSFLCLLGACASKGSVKSDLSKPLKQIQIPFEVVNLSDSVQIRILEKPNLSYLDLAAYYQNPIKKQEDLEAPANYKGLLASTPVKDYPFAVLDSISSEAPEFLNFFMPVAFEPFVKTLASESRDSLSGLLREIEGEKWNEPEVFKPLQRVSKLRGISRHGNEESWIEIEPAS